MNLNRDIIARESIARNLGLIPSSPRAIPWESVTITLDGDQWCALLGVNLQEGLGGFGDTPSDALRDLASAIETYGWNF